MKFLLVSFLVSASAVANQLECVPEGQVDTGKDYFPNKVIPTESQGWDVTYHNTYKVVRNLNANTAYALYQCGTEPPEGEYDAVIAIPLKAAIVGQTTTIPFLEQLGQLESVVGFLTNIQFLSSACLRERIGNGLVATKPVDSASEETVTDLQALLAEQVAFVSPFSTDPFIINPVRVSEYTEKTNSAIFEWIKFFSTFYNMEDRANQLFEAAHRRFECVASSASLITEDQPKKPVVLWAYYSSFCGGWDVAKCPNYYCEYGTACSVDLLDGSTIETYSIDACGAKYMTTDELVAFGKDADHWIFPSDNWEQTYQEFGDQLDTMKAVQDKEVFDYLGSGQNAWFEERFPAYFNVLHDFCGVVGTTTRYPGQPWFRNVFTQSVGAPPDCTGEIQHIIPSDTCVPADFGVVPKETSAADEVSIVAVFANSLALLL